MMTSASPTENWERTNLRLPAVQKNDSTSNSASGSSTSTTAGANATTPSPTPTTASQEYSYLCLPPTLDSATTTTIAIADKDEDDDQHSINDIINHHHNVEHQHAITLLDRYLPSVPQLAASTRQLLLQHHHPKIITATNCGRIINVLQGEMAHCTPSQADVLVSDDATTCHILGLWSYSTTSCSGSGSYTNAADSRARDVNVTDGKFKLATLAHIDGPGYQDCIRDAIELHYQYHSSQQQQQKTRLNGDDNTNTTTIALPVVEIELSIHLMGGYNDNDGTSHEITEGILRALSNVSNDHVNRQQQQQQQQPQMHLTLQTCAVSSSNDNGSGCPIGRGLALDVSVGAVYLAEVQEEQEDDNDDVESSSSSSSSVITTSAQGPDCLLRQTRLWASFLFDFDDCDNDAHNSNNNKKNKRKLQIIHHPNEEYLYISPFYFAPHPFPHRMLALNDALLLQYTSSSPEVEKDNFVRHVRETFRYMNRTSCFHVFKKKTANDENDDGDEQDEWHVRWNDKDYLPRRYRRVGLNGWAAVA